MLIAAQAWNLKAWLALSLPPPDGPQREKQKQERTGAAPCLLKLARRYLERDPQTQGQHG
jgi:hypothetical protein